MTDKQPETQSRIDPEKLEKLMNKVAELAEAFGNNLNIDHITEILDIVCASDDYFLKGTSHSDDFLSFADLEQLLLEEGRRIHDANLKSLFQGMRRMAAEESIIAQKKTPSGRKE
ncbi:MAG: hypothetical protein LBS31_08325 [Candidatus Adiutrix sp.]|jgi:hypothetical protein|nr:hypothetical protein [Candidatus Adiutrix sp.]